MPLSSPVSVADSFASIVNDGGGEFNLGDGSRIAVVGGGPAGSFFSWFCLKMADAIDMDLSVDIYEPRSFDDSGPAGCNHCGGIVSESLVQRLATEGMRLPNDVVQRGIESYTLHMDVGDVAIESPVHEQRIAALYRGNGPREGGHAALASFDGFLQDMAVGQGARVVNRLINGTYRTGGRPGLEFAGGGEQDYDLVAVASGVNSNFIDLLGGLDENYTRPKTTRAYICEFRSTEEEVLRHLGRSVDRKSVV